MGEKKPDRFDKAVTIMVRLAWSLILGALDTSYIVWMFSADPREAIMVAMMIHLPGIYAIGLLIMAINKKRSPPQEVSMSDLSLVDSTIASLSARMTFYTLATLEGIALGWFFGVTW